MASQVIQKMVKGDRRALLRRMAGLPCQMRTSFPPPPNRVRLISSNLVSSLEELSLTWFLNGTLLPQMSLSSSGHPRVSRGFQIPLTRLLEAGIKRVLWLEFPSSYFFLSPFHPIRPSTACGAGCFPAGLVKDLAETLEDPPPPGLGKSYSFPKLPLALAAHGIPTLRTWVSFCRFLGISEALLERAYRFLLT